MSSKSVLVTDSTTPIDQVVLDTCVLLSDPSSMFMYSGKLLVLPLTVVEELDKHKSRMDAVGWAARECLRTLERIRIEAGGDLRLPYKYEENWLRVETNGIHRSKLTDLGLSLDRNDNRILAACLGLTENGPVTFFNDFNITVEEKIGKILFFSPLAKHSVLPSNLNKSRYTISFNFQALENFN